MAIVMDGKLCAAELKRDIAAEIAKTGIKATLAVVIVGENPASRIYVNNKKKDCEDCGIKSEEYALPADYGEQSLLRLIDDLNSSADISGILVQLPLPKGYDEIRVVNAIAPEKDVDAFHPVNVGHIMIGDYTFLPCTPSGVMELLERYGIEIAGKHCVVVGRSNIVGKPQAMLLLQKDGTVTVCHSKTPRLGDVTRTADILISAVGKEKLITADMIKENAVVIDVAMNRRSNGKLCGDVDYEAAFDKASYITPVPGGVGPMTRAVLMKNTLTAAKLRIGGDSGGI